MVYSIVINGVVHDYRYRSLRDNIYTFYVGEKRLGQIHRMPRNKWTAIAAISPDQSRGFIRVDGFSSRFDASEYILRVWGFIQ